MLVAKNYYYEAQVSKNITYDNISVSEFFDVKRDGSSVYYAFNFKNGGFVIVSADDLFAPIIGFSPEGEYSETDAPENWKWLMSEYAEMIAFGQKQQMDTDPKYSDLWVRLSANEPSLTRENRGIIVAPLCSALWNQDSPYNYYAPVDNIGPGGKAYAGCVATAMSIIMHYWRWPLQGSGENTYNPNVGSCSAIYPILSANFGETVYKFEGMSNKISYGLNNPVALLMYHCGVAVDMMFCHSGSGAYSDDVPNAIKTFFKYDNSASIYSKQSMSEQNWKNKLKTDLNKGYPIYNSGCSSSGCHAFVCDGYNSDDLFHYNFGWGGAANGYYAVNNVYGFYSWQNIITNFIPDETLYNSECQEFTTVNFADGIITDCSGPVQNYKPNTNAAWLIDPYKEGDNARKTITIEWTQFDLAEGDFLRIYDGDSESSPILAEYTKGSQPQALTAENSKMFIRFTSSPTSETAKGFMFNFSTASPLSCKSLIATVLTEPEGTFEDGSGENYNYSNALRCKWKIIPKNATSIDITFNYLETEADKDYVQIVNLENNKIIASLSGVYTKENLPVITVPSGKVQINFNTNMTINAKGFELNYKATILEDGIEEHNQAVGALKIFPNPASNYLNLSFSTPHNDNFNIDIYNILGVKLYNENLTNFSGNYNKTINVEMLSKGIYFLKITSSNGISVKKIIIN